MPVFKDLRAKLGYSKTSHHDFWLLLAALYKNLVNNPYFPKPPVDLALFKAKIDEYWEAISATLGGAKLAFAQRDSLRKELNKMFTLLASYVEHESHNDPAIFVTSGLEAQPNSRVLPEPLARPRISRIEHGYRSGELNVWMPTSLRKIKSCDLRYTAVDETGVPTGDWTEIPVTSFQGPVIIKNLKPGTRYAFQVRALGNLGMTDWSNSAIKMCT
jgi:hypothetical protein